MMLRHFGQQRLSSVNSYFVSLKRFASNLPAAYTDWAKRYDELTSSHPKLFSNDFIKEQESILSKHYNKDNLNKLVTDYNSSRKAVDKATGESVFLSYDVDDVLNLRPKPVQTIVQSKDEALTKLEQGTKYVKELLKTQSQKTNSIEEANLKMIKVADYADAIDHWRARLPDSINDRNVLELPITDQELDKWVEKEYFHAPEEVRVQSTNLTFDEHRKIEEAWMKELDESLISLLKSRDSSINEKKLREWLNTSNDLFHPFKIDHYTFSNFAKALFRSALWNSKEQLNNVVNGMNTLQQMLENSNDNDTLILRKMYEEYPDTPLNNLAALQLEILDPLFGARLCDEARSILENKSFERAVKDVLRELELPYIKNEKKAVENELKDSSANPAVLMREARLLDEEAESYNMKVPTLDNVLDELLPKRLWGNDITKVKNAILEYSNGKGSLEKVNNAISETLKPGSEKKGLTDDEILQISVRYHNARYSDVRYWNLNDFMIECGRVRKEEFLLNAQRVIKEKLESVGCDKQVINMLSLIIANDETECNRLKQVVNDFDEIMKQYRGEIDAVVSSATELDSNTVAQLQKALETANPGKTITMVTSVDPALQSGFVVKAGTQRFDFSLSSAIYEGKRAIGQ